MCRKSTNKFIQIVSYFLGCHINRFLNFGKPLILFTYNFIGHLIFNSDKFLEAIFIHNRIGSFTNVAKWFRAVMYHLLCISHRCLWVHLCIRNRCNVTKRIKIFLFPNIDTSFELWPLVSGDSIFNLFLKIRQAKAFSFLLTEFHLSFWLSDILFDFFHIENWIIFNYSHHFFKLLFDFDFVFLFICIKFHYIVISNHYFYFIYILTVFNIF